MADVVVRGSYNGNPTDINAVPLASGYALAVGLYGHDGSNWKAVATDSNGVITTSPVARAVHYENSTLLGNAETRTSTWASCLTYSRLTGYVATDKNFTFAVHHAIDSSPGANEYAITSYTVTGSDTYNFKYDVNLYGRYVRISIVDTALAAHTKTRIAAYYSTLVR